MAVAKLSGGHNSSVLCIDAYWQSDNMVSGGENGELCIWTQDGLVLERISRPGADCTSVFCSRNNANLVYAAFGEEVLVLDTRVLEEPVCVFHSNQDEVNQVVLDEKEQFLAACDDSGEIKVFGLQDRKVFKTLRHKHTNICSTVVFRRGHQWEVVSGGLDCRLVHWDFSKPKCLNQFNLQELYATPGEASYMINPPFIHHITTSLSGGTFACALENGQIPIFSGNHKNIRPKYALFGGSQGVSQVHFLSEEILISGGNDCSINQWDLTKSELYQPEVVHMNGHGVAPNPEEDKNLAITQLCKVRSFAHPNKVNWMVPISATQRLYIADQTSDISVLDLS